MTLEEINDIPDKDERLKQLKKYIQEKLSDSRIFDRFEATYCDDSEPGNDDTFRDEAGGMMSKHGKPKV